MCTNSQNTEDSHKLEFCLSNANMFAKKATIFRPSFHKSELVRRISHIGIVTQNGQLTTAVTVKFICQVPSIREAIDGEKMFIFGHRPGEGGLPILDLFLNISPKKSAAGCALWMSSLSQRNSGSAARLLSVCLFVCFCVCLPARRSDCPEQRRWGENWATSGSAACLFVFLRLLSAPYSSPCSNHSCDDSQIAALIANRRRSAIAFCGNNTSTTMKQPSEKSQPKCFLIATYFQNICAMD